jgi:hypothetical protein
MNSDSILSIGLKCAGHDTNKNWNKSSQLAAFRSLYGIQPESVYDVMNDISTESAYAAKTNMNHKIIMMFVTLYWLRSYDIADNILRIFGIGSKVTVRKYIRIYLEALQTLCHSKVKNQ